VIAFYLLNRFEDNPLVYYIFLNVMVTFSQWF
jgi:hypothetical protein